MQRRKFVCLFGGLLAAWPLTSEAQAQSPDRVRYVAWLGLGHAGPSPYLDSLRTGLRELGWVEGRNMKIVAFWATGREDMEGVAREVLASDPDVVVTQELMAIAMLNLQSAKPVVFGFSGDPVDGKLVQSWARPGRNFTGMSYLAIELVGKRIELLKEWLPQIQRVAVLARPQHPGAHLEQQATEAVLKKLGLDSSYFPYQSESFLPARDLSELGVAFRCILQDRCDALVVFPDSAMYEVSDSIAQFALQAKLPSVSGWSPFAQKGMLMTYGPDVRDLYRNLARYTDRILRGTKPADLPVEVPTKFYLAVNQKMAKVLDLTVPPTLLARADEVIE
jgi:putative ABC transport system substrate-binding protein